MKPNKIEELIAVCDKTPDPTAITAYEYCERWQPETAEFRDALDPPIARTLLVELKEAQETVERQEREQKATCAACKQHKATPLRRDEMGGYVCLTCVETELDNYGTQLNAKLDELAATREQLEKLEKGLRDISDWGCTVADYDIFNGKQCWQTEIGHDAWCPSCTANALLNPDAYPDYKMEDAKCQK